MPIYEVRASWKQAFAAERIRRARLEHLAQHPESARAFSRNGEAFHFPRNGALAKASETPLDLPHRPIEPLGDASSFEERAERVAFFDQIVRSIVRNGASRTRMQLRRMGFSPGEVQALCRMAHRELGESVGHDLDEHKAVAIRRYEELFRAAFDGLDYKTAISAQKQLDRVTGVVSDDGSGGGRGELAVIAELVTRGDRSMEKVVDVDARMSEEDDETLVSAIPVSRVAGVLLVPDEDSET